jgi:hypothetical protein
MQKFFFLNDISKYKNIDVVLKYLKKIPNVLNKIVR